MSAIVLGVGPGLGLALAHAYADTGRRVAVVSRRQDDAAGFAADLPDAVLLEGTPSQVSLDAVETSWRVGCLGAWAALQAAVPLMDDGSAFFVTGGGLALEPWPPASARASALS